jgi:hypothetical protein
MFRGRKRPNKKAIREFEMDGFIVRVSSERVDIENRGKTWKTCLFPPSQGYMMCARILVPEAFRDERGVQEGDKKAIENIAKTLFAATATVFGDPAAVEEMWDVFSTSVERRMNAGELPPDDELVLAEERALVDPSIENVQEVERIRKKNEESEG